MPEGHTIHRLAKDLAKDLRHHEIAASSPQGRFADSAARFDGAVLTRTEAWGKHLFSWWDNGELLHVHLGLIGKWRRRPSPPPEVVGAVRLRLEGPDHTWDLSGPTTCRLITPGDRDKVVDELGPDPLRRNADPDRFAANLARRKVPIGQALLDQKVVAGIGNVYRAELLFICGIHPLVPANRLDLHEVRGLWDEMVAQLKAGVRRNRIVTVDPAFMGKPLSRLRRDESVWVYKREHCRRCGSELEVIPLGGRRIWACPVHQPRS